MINYDLIGRKIKFYRQNSHISQSKLAEILDVSISYISQVERGTTKVSLERLDTIASALDQDICLFLSDTNPSSIGYCNSTIQDMMNALPGSDKERVLDYIDMLLSKRQSRVAED